MRQKLILIAIIFLGFLLRVVFINSSPSSLYGDELTITLDAYSLLKTGHDQLGNFMPLTFPMGAGRPAGYVYGSIPFVAIFGPSALGVRSLSILSGIGILVLLYLIGRKIFSEKVGLLAAAIGAVSPWDISLSRGGFEAHFALFLALLGTYLFIKAKEKPPFYLFSALSFGLTLHTYPTYKISLILFLPLLFWFSRAKEEVTKSKYFLGGVVVFITLGILVLSQTFVGGSETRFSNINIFSKEESRVSIEQKINFERKINNLPDTLTRYFHNKPVEYFKVFIENYLQNFSLDFLVLHGDRNPRHNMATMGEIYAVEIILILLGLWNLHSRSVKSIPLLEWIVAWIILAPIPTAIVDLPHALRSSFMLPPLLILSALGLSTILWQRSKFLISLVALIFIIQFMFFIQKLYFLAPNEFSNFWSYPAKLASNLAINNKNNFKYVILSDRIDSIEFAYPVYGKIAPSVVISQNYSKYTLANYSFKKMENVFIGALPESNIQDFMEKLEGSILYVGPASDAKFLKEFNKIEGPDKTPILITKKISINLKRL